MPEHSRADDFTIGTLVAELKAHREEFSRYRNDSERWRSEMETRTKITEDYFKKVDTPLKVIWASLSIVGITFVGAIATWSIHWFGKHWVE